MRSHQKSRSGATAVEFAFVLPIFLVLVFGVIVYGHMRMVDNLVTGACRDAARHGATDGVTSADAMARVQTIVSSGMSIADVNIVVKDVTAFDNGGTIPVTENEVAALPNIELANADPRQMFLIRASVDYTQVSIIPLPWINQTLVGQAIMRHE